MFCLLRMTNEKVEPERTRYVNNRGYYEEERGKKEENKTRFGSGEGVRLCDYKDRKYAAINLIS